MDDLPRGYFYFGWLGHRGRWWGGGTFIVNSDGYFNQYHLVIGVFYSILGPPNVYSVPNLPSCRKA